MSTFSVSSPGSRAPYVHQGRVDVVAALPVDGDEERQAAVRGQDVHTAVLLVVPGQERDAAVLHPQRGRHHVESLWDKWERWDLPAPVRSPQAADFIPPCDAIV